MMKKILIFAMASLVAVAFLGCKKSGEYADLKEYLNEVIKINEEYVSALEKAEQRQGSRRGNDRDGQQDGEDRERR